MKLRYTLIIDYARARELEVALPLLDDYFGHDGWEILVLHSRQELQINIITNTKKKFDTFCLDLHDRFLALEED